MKILSNQELTNELEKIRRLVCCCPEPTIVSADAGNDITIGTDGGAYLDIDLLIDTNFGNTDLTFTGTRSHDAGAFGWDIGGLTAGGVTTTLGVSATGEFSFQASDGAEVGSILAGFQNIDLSVTDGVETGQIVIGPAAVQFNQTSGGYIFGNGAGGNLPPQSAATWDLGLDANGNVVLQEALNANAEHFGINIDEGGVVSTGYKGRLIVPYDGTITGWTILETSETPITGSIVVDVLLGTYANYDTTPTFATIAGTEKPTISADVKGQDLTLTTWTTAVAAGDIIQFSVDSAATVEKVYVSIHITRS